MSSFPQVLSLPFRDILKGMLFLFKIENPKSSPYFLKLCTEYDGPLIFQCCHTFLASWHPPEKMQEGKTSDEVRRRKETGDEFKEKFREQEAESDWGGLRFREQRMRDRLEKKERE